MSRSHINSCMSVFHITLGVEAWNLAFSPKCVTHGAYSANRLSCWVILGKLFNLSVGFISSFVKWQWEESVPHRDGVVPVKCLGWSLVHIKFTSNTNLSYYCHHHHHFYDYIPALKLSVETKVSHLLPPTPRTHTRACTPPSPYLGSYFCLLHFCVPGHTEWGGHFLIGQGTVLKD